MRSANHRVNNRNSKRASGSLTDDSTASSFRFLRGPMAASAVRFASLCRTSSISASWSCRQHVTAVTLATLRDNRHDSTKKRHQRRRERRRKSNEVPADVHLVNKSKRGDTARAVVFITRNLKKKKKNDVIKQ